METPSNLLRSSIYENDGYKRTLNVIKACKLVTDTLPFDKKNPSLLEDSELVKYLMLSLPLNPRAIDMIIFSMIEKFQSNHFFLKEMWLGFLFVAKLEEPEQTRNSQLFQKAVTKTILSIKSPKANTSRNLSAKEEKYCSEIEKNKEMLKLAVLNYLDKILEIYLRKLKDKIPFQPDIPLILKHFLTYTQSEKVIIKVCTLIQKVKKADTQIQFDNQFEEIILSKKPPTYEFSPPTKANFEPIPKAKVSRSGSQVRTPASVDNGGSPMNISRGNEFEGAFSNSTKNEIISRTSAAESEIDDMEGEADESDVAYLDKWLCSWEIEDVPQVSRDEAMLDLIQKRENFQAFLLFIFDPRHYPISEKWKKKHNQKFESYKEEDGTPRSGNTLSVSPKQKKVKNQKILHPYILRSFKAMQTMCDVRNFKYIMQCHKQGLELYFTNLYMCFVPRDNQNICNFNHLAKIMEYFLRKDSHGCVYNLIKFNLLFKFLENLEFPYVQHFFYTLFGCSMHSKDLEVEPIRKILVYCKITSFFNDLANAIFLGEQKLDLNKLNIDYKPIGVGPLLERTTEDDVYFFPQDERPKTYSMNYSEPYLIEETKGYSLDIDNLQSAIKAKSTIDLNKLRKLAFNRQRDQPSPAVKEKRYRKQYPSVLEKRRKFFNLDLPNEHSGFEHHNNSNMRSLRTSKTTIIRHIPSKSSTFNVESLGVSPRNMVSNLTTPNEKKFGLTLETASPDTQETIITENGPKEIQVFNRTPVKSYQNLTSERDNILGSPPVIRQIKPLDKKLSLPVLDLSKTMREVKEKVAVPVSLGVLKIDLNSQRESQISNIGKPGTMTERVNPRPSDNQIKPSKPSEPKSPSKLRIESPFRSSEVRESRAPREMTTARQLRTDGLEKEELDQLNKLYPLSARDTIVQDIDKEAQKSEFNVENIKAKDNFALIACEFLEELFKRAFMPMSQQENPQESNTKNEEENKKKKAHLLKVNLGAIDVDHSQFWNTVFEEECQVFEILFKNYIIKAKMNAFGQSNSSYAAGKAVNIILEKCGQKHPYLEKWSKKIFEICKKHFNFLCKIIIQSHAWRSKDELKVYLQDFQVTDLMGTGRLLLVTTFSHIINIDCPKSYELLYQVNDTCWHTLITWFFSKKTNNIYQRSFYTILETALLNTNEKFVLNLLFKLNIVSNMYDIWREICQNNVLLKDQHIDSMICYLKKIYNLVECIAETNEKYKSLRNQLASSISWKSFQSKFSSPTKKVNTNQSIRTVSVKSKRNTRAPEIIKIGSKKASNQKVKLDSLASISMSTLPNKSIIGTSSILDSFTKSKVNSPEKKN